MTDDQLFCLEVHLPRLMAEETLEKAKRGEVQLTRDGWYKFTLAATGDKEKAEEAAYQYSHERIKRDLNPE